MLSMMVTEYIRICHGWLIVRLVMSVIVAGLSVYLSLKMTDIIDSMTMQNLYYNDTSNG